MPCHVEALCLHFPALVVKVGETAAALVGSTLPRTERKREKVMMRVTRRNHGLGDRTAG
jgi:hypothetical protein